MKIAVVDDERPARRELVYLLRECMPDAEILEAGSSEQLLELLKEHSFDACFVDINLGGANGTTLASMIRSSQPGAQIVFATAYGEYAVKAFEMGASDYLLKPFDVERVRKTAERLRERKEESAASAAPSLNKLMVNSGTGFRVLNVEDILFIETENRSCRIHTGAESYLENESMNYFEEKLRDKRFFRIHKSYLVNMDAVLAMEPLYNNGYGVRIRGLGDRLLPIGRTQMKEFKRFFEG